MREKDTRLLKVIGQSGYKYQEVPTIILKGKWLEAAGYEIGEMVKIRSSSREAMNRILQL